MKHVGAFFIASLFFLGVTLDGEQAALERENPIPAAGLPTEVDDAYDVPLLVWIDVTTPVLPVIKADPVVIAQPIVSHRMAGRVCDGHGNPVVERFNATLFPGDEIPIC